MRRGVCERTRLKLETEKVKLGDGGRSSAMQLRGRVFISTWQHVLKDNFTVF